MTGTTARRDGYIRVKDVFKIYETRTASIEAVSNANFSVAQGEFVAIVGPSGCGKSTLLMMCGGLEPITSGSIEIAGAPMTAPRTSIGVMFQDSTLFGWKTVFENVMFPIHILRRDKKQYAAHACELLELVGLQGFEDKKPRELSGGMRQRVAICRALVYDPDILLMDEPFSALDAITRDEMNLLLLDLWQRYTKTALFVTHSIREAVLLADRVLVMTRRPAAVVEDLRIPFPRPRSPEIGDTKEFNDICVHIRSLIESGHGRRQGRPNLPRARQR
jgi:NitT/TauT family transport system ATP-binding protein